MVALLKLFKKNTQKKINAAKNYYRYARLTNGALSKRFKKIGGKGLFIKQLDKALLNKEVDLAVNCMKDIPQDYWQEKKMKIKVTRIKK